MKKLLLENVGLKITAVFLSVILWIFVTSRGQSEIALDVPIEFKGIPQGMEIASQSDKVVSLNLRGQERILKKIRPADISVSLDFSKAKPGENTYYIHREDVRIPYAISVSNINPSSVKVLIEETARKTVKVVPVIVGEPEEGFAVKSVIVNPQQVEIEGIKREIRRVSTLKTEPCDVTGMNETFSQDVRLDLTGRNVRAKNPSVTVQVVIGKKGRRA